jgi:hypothetical protein
MAELKTKVNDSSVQKFLESITDDAKRNDCYKLIEIIKSVIDEEPEMWGDSIVGFGRYHYKYKSGREGDWFITGFSPRKNNLTVYLMSGFSGKEELLSKLGRHKTAQSCLYLKNLEDINIQVLKKLIKESVQETKKMYR